jgi:pimeloyl-ACP methyl ester carboxylesterase
MQILNANNVSLAYDSFGDEAAEAILLISGLGTQMIRWTVPFCQELVARGYRVVRFDNRDAGCSTHFTDHAIPDFGALVAMLMAGQRPEVPYTLYDMAKDTVGLLDALSLGRAQCPRVWRLRTADRRNCCNRRPPLKTGVHQRSDPHHPWDR